MVSRARPGLRLAAAFLTLVATLLACDPEAPLVRRTDEPVVVVVLSREPVTPFDTMLGALLATAATPARHEYRAASRFEMRRAADGARLDWRDASTLPARPPSYDPRFGGANWFIASPPAAGMLGRYDLTPGRYDLEIESEGRVITGSAVVPEAPRPLVVSRDGQWVVEWPRASGAAIYYVWNPFTGDLSSGFTRDTLLVLAPDTARTAVDSLVVLAYDENWAAYMLDRAATRAGLQGAYGVFGASAQGWAKVPAGAAR